MSHRPHASGDRFDSLKILVLCFAAVGCPRAKTHEVDEPTAKRPPTVVVPQPAPIASPSPKEKPAEADFGLPFYPGAAFDESSLQRTAMGAYYQIHASFETAASPETVVAFYRDEMKALAPTADALVETRQAEKTTLILKRDAHRLSLVAIEPREGSVGSDIELSATGERAAPVTRPTGR